MSLYCMPVARDKDTPREDEHELVFGWRQGKLQKYSNNNKLFFEQQEELVARMHKVSESSESWGANEWVFDPHDFLVRVWKPEVLTSDSYCVLTLTPTADYNLLSATYDLLLTTTDH